MNTTTLLATALSATFGTMTFAAPPPDYMIDGVTSVTTSWAEARDFGLNLYDQLDDTQEQFWLALMGMNSTSWADANGAFGNGSGHCSATESENSFQVFGDSHAYFGIEDNQWAKGDGNAGTKVGFSLGWNCRVSGQFCVRGDGFGGGAGAVIILYPETDPTNQLVFIDLADGEGCRDFDLILPPGNYTVRATSNAFADSDIAPGEGANSWSQFAAEVNFEGIAHPDIDNSGHVDGFDLARFLAQWGSDNPDFDFNGDGVVDGQDLAILLSNWG